MTEVRVTPQDMARLGAKLDAIAEILDDVERAMLLAVLQLATEAWSTRRREADPTDEVSGFALRGDRVGMIVVTTDPVPPPSAYLGGPGIVLDNGHVQAVPLETGRRRWGAVTISLSSTGSTTFT